MPEHLLQIVPDVEALVAMPVEDVAHITLGLAVELAQLGNNGTVHFAQIAEQVHGTRHDYSKGYPQNRKAEAERALNEAWHYLVRQGLLVPEPGTNGVNGWHRPTERGKEVAGQRDIQSFKEAAAFPKDLLHPSITQDVWMELARGNYEVAVFKSMRAVEIAVRTVCRYPPELVGTDLVRRAFGRDGPLTRSTEPAAEQEALAHMFAGAIGYYKNPQSHRAVNVEPKAAREAALLASHLLRIVEERTPRP